MFETLLYFYGLRRVNARGRMVAHQMMLMVATAYNLQELAAFAGGPKVKVNALAKALPKTLYFFIHL